MAQKKPASASPVGEINIREELEKYLRYWPWFLLCGILALGIAFLLLRNTTPVYSTTATILIKDSENSEMAAFSELGMFSGLNDNGIEDEIGLMKSRNLMEGVVKALKLNIRYFDEEALRSPEMYNNSPLVAETILLDEEKLRNSPHKTYRLVYKGNDKVQVTRLSDEKTFEMTLGHPLDFGFGQVVLRRNEEVSQNLNSPILLQFEPIRNIARAYMANMTIQVKQKGSNMVELKLDDPVRAKAEDILDKLIEEYNKEAIKDKNLVATNTAEFIQERLAIINEELDSVETGKVEFKESNKFINIESASESISSSAYEYEQRLKEVEMQIELAEAVLEYLSSSSTSDLLPANLGITEGGVNSSIQAYNDLVLERNRILSGSTERNPTVVKLTRQVGELRSGVLKSLNQMLSSLSIEEETLQRQAGILGAKISTVPAKEQQFRGIERQQQIKEALYLFLLQKREENSLTLAVTAPKAKIVDEALSIGGPVTPNPRNMYLTALLLGLGIPFAFLYLKNLLNNKVRNKSDIEKVVDIPVVGEIPKIARNQSELIEKNDRSVLAESFRILHTNLQYLLVNAGKKPGGNTIFVTSTIKGEGKTFAAFNLAMTLANAEKKVVIVGADLRNPQLQRFEPGVKQHQGVSNYLVNREKDLRALIQASSLHPNLSLLPSGSIPPNPSELWRQEQTAVLFAELSRLYDYVIVDTAPAMLVTDTFLISEYADLTLYLVRAGYTETKLLQFSEEVKEQNKLRHLAIVLNNVDSANFGYGNKYAYGYSYGEQDKGFWEKLKNKAAFW